MACYIFGAGSFYGLSQRPVPGDTIIAADGGWEPCRGEGLTPDLLLGDFDSLHTVPDFAHIRRVPVEKDDTDMLLAIKEGLARGDGEQFTAICGGEITLPAREKGIVSVFCMGADAQGVTIEGGQYTVHDTVLTASFPLGVSNHFVGNPVRVAVTRGSLLIGLIEKE